VHEPVVWEAFEREWLRDVEINSMECHNTTTFKNSQHVAKINQMRGEREVILKVVEGVKGMDRKDLLQQNGAIFKGQAKYIQDNASKDVKICVVGNPANTNASIISEFAPGLNPKNISALTRLAFNLYR